MENDDIDTGIGTSAIGAGAIGINANIRESNIRESNIENTYGSEPSDSDNDSFIDIDKDNGKDNGKDMNNDGGRDKYSYKKLSYNDVKKHLNESYQQDIVHRYSSALDILASYLKGQKIIYMESRAYTVSNLNYLMLPSIFITAGVSIIQVPLRDTQYGAIVLSALSAFVVCLLSIINYLKLESEAEAHKISSHRYDKLQSFVEFQSGQVLLFSETYIDQDSSNSEAKLIEKMRETIKTVETSIEDIKVINQFIIPTVIRYNYPIIYNTNIFSVIKKIDDYKSKTITDLKNVKNELRFINSLQKQHIPDFNQRASILFIKKKKIIDTILNLNTAFSMIDKMFQEEIYNVNLKKKHCFGFWLNDVINKFCCFNKKSTYCLPDDTDSCKYDDRFFEKFINNDVDLHV